MDVIDIMSILRIADFYMMDNIKEKAIRFLDRINEFPTLIEKMECGRSYYRPWIRQAYKELIGRKEPLTEEEGKFLGMRNVLRCSQAREKYVAR
ncbi:hypothetical protein M422DRAFT_162909 [Sphaerobolus stellatus SS14]|nr:hypothetical protein M422DRAFT_162909 [Sphaerobolus stellatus SS14]